MELTIESEIVLNPVTFLSECWKILEDSGSESATNRETIQNKIQSKIQSKIHKLRLTLDNKTPQKSDPLTACVTGRSPGGLIVRLDRLLVQFFSDTIVEMIQVVV